VGVLERHEQGEGREPGRLGRGEPVEGAPELGWDLLLVVVERAFQQPSFVGDDVAVRDMVVREGRRVVERRPRQQSVLDQSPRAD